MSELQFEWRRTKIIQAPGKRTKYWFLCPDPGKKYLFKVPHPHTGEAWAEKIAAHLAGMMSFSTFQCEFATYQGTVGVLLENFIGIQEKLFEGVDLLATYIEGFDQYSLYRYEFVKKESLSIRFFSIM
ncbi:hypothetical protein JQN58_17855 [Aneurinibacillus sp. BA2021]|nr:hypothetical protein [Aneurinibacillus sp. BA2021]